MPCVLKFDKILRFIMKNNTEYIYLKITKAIFHCNNFMTKEYSSHISFHSFDKVSY